MIARFRGELLTALMEGAPDQLDREVEIHIMRRTETLDGG